VILQDPEYREIQRIARSRGMSLAGWVQQALDFARRCEPVGSADKKLDVIRSAVRHDYPTSDIEGMLEYPRRTQYTSQSWSNTGSNES
jgi:hypothetical protein